jgi:ABC-type Mn2+/Zn2+ transport system permease subunit
MADSLSHSLLPGLVLGVLIFGFAPQGLFFGALFAASFVALGAQLISRSSRIKEDTALGILYTVAFSLGLVLLTFVKVRVSLLHYLFGNILGLADSDLWLSYGIALVVVPVMAALQRPFLLSLFEPNVARSQGVRVGLLNLVLTILLVLTMTASVQAVGVILMVGLLLAPAATVYLLTDSFPASSGVGDSLGFVGRSRACCSRITCRISRPALGSCSCWGVSSSWRSSSARAMGSSGDSGVRGTFMKNRWPAGLGPMITATAHKPKSGDPLPLRQARSVRD